MVPLSHPCRRRTGFTLVELMIVLAILAILAVIAWPAYNDSVRRSRRADAMAGVSTIMQAQERFRANRTTYQATLADLPGAGADVSADGHYSLSLHDVDASNYTVRATARSTSPQAADSRCRVMQVAVTGGTLTYRSGSAADALNALPDPCWAR